MNYQAIEQQVKALKQQVAAGEIDQPSFEARLLALMTVGDDGYYWMFGHKSESWYRHDGQRWVLDSPGELLEPLSEAEGGEKPSRTLNHQSVSFLPLPQPEDAQLDWNWFLAGLTFLTSIAVVIYMATSRL